MSSAYERNSMQWADAEERRNQQLVQGLSTLGQGVGQAYDYYQKTDKPLSPIQKAMGYVGMGMSTRDAVLKVRQEELQGVQATNSGPAPNLSNIGMRAATLQAANTGLSEAGGMPQDEVFQAMPHLRTQQDLSSAMATGELLNKQAVARIGADARRDVAATTWEGQLEKEKMRRAGIANVETMRLNQREQERQTKKDIADDRNETTLEQERLRGGWHENVARIRQRMAEYMTDARFNGDRDAIRNLTSARNAVVSRLAQLVGSDNQFLGVEAVEQEKLALQKELDLLNSLLLVKTYGMQNVPSRVNPRQTVGPNGALPPSAGPGNSAAIQRQGSSAPAYPDAVQQPPPSVLKGAPPLRTDEQVREPSAIPMSAPKPAAPKKPAAKAQKQVDPEVQQMLDMLQQ